MRGGSFKKVSPVQCAHYVQCLLSSVLTMCALCTLCAVCTLCEISSEQCEHYVHTVCSVQCAHYVQCLLSSVLTICTLCSSLNCSLCATLVLASAEEPLVSWKNCANFEVRLQNCQLMWVGVICAVWRRKLTTVSVTDQTNC